MNKNTAIAQIMTATCLLCAGAGIASAEDSPLIKRGDALTARNMLTSTRGYGVANAMAASASGTAAIWHNPAGIAEATMYSIDAAYIYDHDAKSHGFEVNLVDSKSNQYVAAGLGLIYDYSNSGGKQHLSNARIGLAVPFADRLVSIGVTAMHSFIKRKSRKIVSQFSMDAGIIIRPIEWISVGFAAQNLIVGDYEAYMPRMISAGIAVGSVEYGFNVMFDTSFNISADNISDTGSYAVGAEYVLKKLVPIRAGYRYSNKDRHVLAVGLGYRHDGGVFGMDLAYQHHFHSPTSDIFSAALDFYF